MASRTPHCPYKELFPPSSVWPRVKPLARGEGPPVPVSKPFSDRLKARGSKRTSLFPSIPSRAVWSSDRPLPPLLAPTHPVGPRCLSHLCRFGRSIRFVCAPRASSQEISCDGNSGETSCWLGHCRGLITRTTQTSAPEEAGKVRLHFSESERARKCKCAETSGVSLGQHFPEARSCSWAQQALREGPLSQFSGLLASLQRRLPAGTFCLIALRGGLENYLEVLDLTLSNHAKLPFSVMSSWVLQTLFSSHT